MMLILVLLVFTICHINAMNNSLQEIIKKFDGKIGLHAINLKTNHEIGERADEYFPMASTRKILLASYLFDLIDKKQLSLEKYVTIRNADVVPGSGVIKKEFHKPNTERLYDVLTLLELMITESDNTAADVLMRVCGGHEAVDSWIATNNIQNIHFKTDLKIWLKKQAVKTLRYKEAQNAIISSSQAPWYYKTLARGASFLEQPTSIDFSDETTNIATPRAMTEFLVQCYNGQAPGLYNNDEYRGILLGFMKRCRTGENRIPKYLPNNPLVMHKTGTGIVGICNDTGMVISPDKTIAMTVFIKDSIKPLSQLEETIAEVSKAVYDAL